jgi:hypothetical protein
MQNFDHNFGFWEKAPIFSPKIVENRRKIVIITSTPGHPATYPKQNLCVVGKYLTIPTWAVELKNFWTADCLTYVKSSM